MSETVGFIGLGVMGAPMAGNLVEAGHSLVVHSRSPEPVDALAEAGAETAQSPREVAERADVVITMLPDSPAVEAVVLGDDGVLAGASEGDLLVDMSTIHPTVSVAVAEAAAERGVAALDAPVSGGDVGAQNGRPVDHGRRRGRGLRAGAPAVRGARQDDRSRRRGRRRAGREGLQPGRRRGDDRGGQRGAGARLQGGRGSRADPRRARRRPGRQQGHGDAPEQLPRARLHAGLPHRPAPQGPQHRARVR